jgi:hypothetical protein
MSDLIYTPPNCRTLASDSSKQQIRLGIQGYPGSGKTVSSSTFPNAIYANFNRGLGILEGQSDIIEIPFYKMASRKTMKDYYTAWLDKEGIKLTSEQTLVEDSLSDLSVYYHQWFKDNESTVAVGKNGRYNDYAEWQEKVKWFEELGNIHLGLKCNVILVCHESERADKPTTVGQPGTYTGKIRPLITGATGDTIVKDYTDWFRQHCAQKPIDYSKITDESLVNWGMKTQKEFKEMCDTFEGPTIYYWQTMGDDLFNAKKGSLVGTCPKYIPANYKSFLKYARKQTTTNQ